MKKGLEISATPLVHVAIKSKAFDISRASFKTSIRRGWINWATAINILGNVYI